MKISDGFLGSKPGRASVWQYLRLLIAGCLCATGPVTLATTTVIMETSLGSFEVRLFDAEAPLTVANFLKYVADGDYQNSFIHRSVRGFVIQGGGYRFTSQVSAVPVDPPIVNEFGRSNLRGTIAMAKIGDDPNSATSQWFINLADNSANLDNQNGGFTVFGEVISTGMSVVDAIAALTLYNAGSPFDSLPLRNYPGGNAQINSNYLVMVNIRIDQDPDDDGIANGVDNCPDLANADQANNDGDPQGDLCDTDDDNDGLADTEEDQYATDPRLADTDGDGRTDGEEIGEGRNPLVNESAILLLLDADA